MRKVSNRILFIDELRGLAIILVVMGHALANNGYKDNSLYNLIYSFHMPLFFCISGFVTMYACKLCVDSNINDYGKYIYKKFIAIMLPCLFWSLIVNPFFFCSFYDISAFKMALKTTIIDNGGYWFLPCLFLLHLIFSIWRWIANRIIKKNHFLIDILLLLILWGGVITISTIDYMRSVSSYFIPFFFGVMISKYDKLRAIVLNNKYVYACSFILFCLIAGLFGHNIMGIMNKIVKLLTGLLAIPLLFNFFSNYKFTQVVENSLSIIGKYTLIIYLLHFVFVEEIPLPINLGIWCQIIVFGVISFLISCTCIFVAKIIEKSPFLSLLMIGKKTQSNNLMVEDS